MIATVTKRIVTVPTLFGGSKVTLTEGTELDLTKVRESGETTPYRAVYVARIVNRPEGSRQPLKLTEQQAADWLVFRRAKDLGYA